MSQFPSMPLFTDAFLADTSHLTAHETGAYLLLLMMAWRLPDGQLPDDDAKLCRWARVEPKQWHFTKPRVMEFWTLDNGFWTQKRLTKERLRVSEMASRSRANGRRGGRPKSLKDNAPENPVGSSQVAQAKAPIPIKKEEDNNRLQGTTPTKVSPAAPSVSVANYAFAHGCVQLVEKDLDKWRKAFPHVAVEAELMSSEPWLAKQPNRWFNAAAGKLAKLERQALERINGSARDPPKKRMILNPLGYYEKSPGDMFGRPIEDDDD